MISGVVNSAATGVRNGDRMRTLNCIIEDRYCVYPTISLVKNWGLDGTGLHCGNISGTGNRYHFQKKSNMATFDLDDIEISECELSLMNRKFLTGGIKRRLVSILICIRGLIKLAIS